VLVVDDEPIVRRFVEAALKREGFTVFTADNGEEALRVSREYNGTIDLLLSDVRMPGMSGPQLVKVLLDERPQTRALLMTGKSSGQIPSALKGLTMRKPFVPKALLARIQDVLGGRRSE
jgi:DNA-binding response OmpR family regulator